MKMVYLLTKWVLLGTLDTNLSGRSTRNERKIVRSKGKEDSAVIVTNLSYQFSSHFSSNDCFYLDWLSLKDHCLLQFYIPGDDDDEVHDVPSISQVAASVQNKA